MSHTVFSRALGSNMKRREFIGIFAGMAAAWPFAARAQQAAARIALLGSGSATTSGVFVDAFKEGLREHGLIEGQHYVLDPRWAEGAYARFPQLAAELAAQRPRVIMVTTIAAVRAAQRVAPDIPIVMTSINDPVGAGLVASLGRPGGNTTGLANMTEDLTPKVVDILRVVVPKAARIAVLYNPANPSNMPMLARIQGSIEKSGGALHATPFKGAGVIEATFADIAKGSPNALLVINDATIIDMRERIASLALSHRIPAFSSIPEMTDAGGIAGYGTPRADLYRRSAYYVKRIFEGAKPADLAVEQPTRIELSINMKTAKALGIAISDTLMARADRVIE
jgi:putative ABC transport system substrate-binding protein